MNYTSKRQAEKAITRLEQCDSITKEYAVKIKALADVLSGEKKPKKQKEAADSGK